MLRRSTLRKEKDVGLCTRAVRTERATRQPQDGMHVTVLHKYIEHIAGLISEQNAVWHDNGRTAARLENRRHVLDEIELLVAGFYYEIVPSWSLVSAPSPKGWFS